MILFYSIITLVLLIPIVYLVFLKKQPLTQHLEANNKYLKYIDSCKECNGIGFHINDESNAKTSDYSLTPCNSCEEVINHFIHKQGEA